ncbi:MAG TPA: ATP-binding protein [Xanthobacteraceae bacterium]|jgi:signal transduction histidine kinase
MKVNTALAFLLAGVALYLLQRPRSSLAATAAIVLAGAAGAIGIASLSEYLFGWRLGIDQLLITDTANAYNAVPGRMSPVSAVAFVVAGVALVSMARPALRGMTVLAAAALLAISSVSLLGYLWNAGDVITDRWLPPVALNTALCFALLAVAVLLSLPRTVNPAAIGRDLRRVEIKVLAGFLVALALLIFAGGYTYTTSVGFADSVEWVAHTQEVRVSLAELSGSIVDAELAQRDFLLAPEQDRKDTFEKLIAESSSRLELLATLVADNPSQVANLLVLRSAVAKRTEVMRAAFTAFDAFGVEAARAVVAAARRVARGSAADILAQAGRMDRVETRLLSERQALSEHKRVVTFISLLITLALAAMLFMGLFRGIRGEMKMRETLEQELQAKAKQLGESNQELESFSYSVSHDLRAPLRAIDGFALMMEEDYIDRLDAEGRRYLTVIRENTKRMGALVDDLLAFSRLGRQAVAKSAVNMDALVREVVDEALRDHKGRPPQIRIAHLPNAHADRGLLRQVWVNLISNALKYCSKSAQPTITLSGERNGNECAYVIKDNGVGFSMDYVEKLFGVFQRLHRADEFEGTGVGLAIVHRIISRHGGRIWAEGKVNQGAAFTFALPAGDNDG